MATAISTYKKNWSFILTAAILMVLILLPRNSYAEAFKIHLFFDPDAKTLKFDEKQSDAVSLDKYLSIGVLETIERSETEKGDYAVVLFDAKDNEIIALQFNPKDGAFDIDLPYFSLAKTLKVIKTADNQEILRANLASFLACDGNKICEIEKGESFNTCLEDCGSGHIVYSQPTIQKLQENKGVIHDEITGEIILRDPKFEEGRNIFFPNGNGIFGNSEDGTGSNIKPLLAMIGMAILAVLFVGFAYFKFIKKK